MREHYEMDKFFNGQELYGNDLSSAEIEQWFADESEGYASLGASDSENYEYLYHGWNTSHGFTHLDPDAIFEKALAFGSAYGEELEPVLARIRSVTMVDPSDAFARTDISGVPAVYVKPSPDGKLPLDDNSHDFATCFGVLHHIPNVGEVLKDIGRVLAPGAHLLLREPVVSMGDWRKPRPGLTKHERGIPYSVLQNLCIDAGFDIERKTLCGFALTPRLLKPFTAAPYKHAPSVAIDRFLSILFTGNLTYHASSPIKKLRPTSAFLVLRKR